MTSELIDIFEGKSVPKIIVIDYSRPKRKNQLKAIITRQREILKRKEVNWQQINSFVIKL